MIPEILTIVFKGICSLLAFIGGLFVARYGFHLYKSGIGTGQGSIIFELGEFKVKAKSVGSVIMATAFLWAWAGVAISPNLEKENGKTHIYSFQTQYSKIEAKPLVTNLDMSEYATETGQEKIKGIFQETIRNQFPKQNGDLKINDQYAYYDLDSIKVEKTYQGNYLLTAKIESESSWVNLAFEPTNLEGKLAFVPKGVDMSSYNTFDPNNKGYPY